MKKFLFATAFAVIGLTAFAQEKMEKKEMKEMKMKDHVCTKSCTKDKHMYAHGEKGHTCTDACKKMKM